MKSTMHLERKFAAWLQGKDDRDYGKPPEPPKWVRENSAYVRFYDSGYYGENYG